MRREDTDELVFRMIGGVFDGLGILSVLVIAVGGLISLLKGFPADDPYAAMLFGGGAGFAAMFFGIGRVLAFLAQRSAKQG